jgi:sulfite exporter TauE/SafE
MTFFSALILGVLASIHCAGMCAGLQGVLQGERSLRSPAQAFHHSLVLNVGRITTYTVLGVILALVGAQALNVFQLQQWILPLRAFTAIILIVIGLQLITLNRGFLSFLELPGKILWNKASQFVHSSSNRFVHSYRNGMIWGLLPCGLLYSVVLTAGLAASVVDAGLVMLGFGVGTLPAMLLSGQAFHSFKTSLSQSGVRTAGGLFFVIGGLLMLSAPYWVSMEFAERYPLLVDSVFCLSQ